MIYGTSASFPILYICIIFPHFLYEVNPVSSSLISTSRKESLLRAYMEFTHSRKKLCTPQSWTQLDRSEIINTEELQAFQWIFDRIFTVPNLTHSYFRDIQQAVRIAQVAAQIHHISSNSTELLNGLFRASVQNTLPSSLPRLVNNIPLYHSNLISILACQGHEVVGFASRDVNEHLVKSNRCREQTNRTLAQSPVFELGEWILNWHLIDCEPNGISRSTLTIPLLIEPKKKEFDVRFIFEFDLMNFTLDQCAADVHRCSPTTTCEYRRYSEWPFAMDNYLCKCTGSFYLDNPENGYRASFIYAQSKNNDQQFRCLPCKPGCAQCGGGNQTCQVQLAPTMLRSVPLAIQSFCVTVCVILGITVFRLRRTRVIRAFNWVLMEILLVGAILLYFIVVVMYFPTNELTCLLVPWLREMGFSVMYGVIFVKIYRVLSGFQSRKAHRVHIRDKDILKFLGIFIITTFTFMVAWTALHLDYMSESPWVRHQTNQPAVRMVQSGRLLVSPKQVLNPKENSSTNESEITAMIFDVCPCLAWDLVVESVEFIILVISLHHCRLVRSAPSEFNETMYISIALIVELAASVIFNIIRHVLWYNTHPDYMFLLYFVRSHITITVNLALIFGPKAWYFYRPSTNATVSGRATAPYTVDPNLAPAGKLTLSLNGDLDIVDVTLSDMDPEVIRRELKRLYTQIELYKTKAMRKDNPHISKRRGGRKQRRFSLQPFHKRHHGSSVPGAVPLMATPEVSYFLTDCRSGRSSQGQCPKHGKVYLSGANMVMRTESHHMQTSIIHDEEVSRLSEESTNSTEDFSPPPNIHEHSVVCATVSSPVTSKPLTTSLSAPPTDGKTDVGRRPPYSPNLQE